MPVFLNPDGSQETALSAPESGVCVWGQLPQRHHIVCSRNSTGQASPADMAFKYCQIVHCPKPSIDWWCSDNAFRFQVLGAVAIHTVRVPIHSNLVTTRLAFRKSEGARLGSKRGSALSRIDRGYRVCPLSSAAVDVRVSPRCKHV